MLSMPGTVCNFMGCVGLCISGQWIGMEGKREDLPGEYRHVAYRKGSAGQGMVFIGIIQNGLEWT